MPWVCGILNAISEFGTSLPNPPRSWRFQICCTKLKNLHYVLREARVVAFKILYSAGEQGVHTSSKYIV